MLAQLRPPLPELTVFGVMIGSGAELVHFMRWSKSLASAAFVARRLIGHGCARARSTAAACASPTATRSPVGCSSRRMDAGVVLWNCLFALKALLRGKAACRGRDRRTGRQTDCTCEARKGVVLACGGFPQDAERAGSASSRTRSTISPAPPGNTGDGLRIAAGARARRIDESLPNAAAWVPVSQVPRDDGTLRPVPALHRPRQAGRDRGDARRAGAS